MKSKTEEERQEDEEAMACSIDNGDDCDMCGS